MLEKVIFSAVRVLSQHLCREKVVVQIIRKGGFAYDEGAGVRQRACGVAVGNLHETLILPSQLYILSLIGDNHTPFSSCKQDENSV